MVRIYGYLFSTRSHLRLNLWVYSILSSFKSPFTRPMSTSIFLFLSSYYYRILGSHYALAPLEVSLDVYKPSKLMLDKFFFSIVATASLSLIPSFRLDPFLYSHKSNTTYAFLQHLSCMMTIYVLFK
jgi:hypothetical protein